MESKHLITLPGRFTRLKGQLDFVQVIADLKSRGLSVHGLLVGETHPRKLSYREKVRAAIQTAGLETNCTLLEHRGDLREIMAVSDAVVSCAAKPEAFGRVTLEALSMGIPVAGYDHGGVREQLNEVISARHSRLTFSAANIISLHNQKQTTRSPKTANRQQPQLAIHNTTYQTNQIKYKKKYFIIFNFPIFKI